MVSGVCWLLFAVCCVLSGGGCMLSVVWDGLISVCCLLFVGWNLALVVCCVSLAVWCLVCV